MHLEAKVSFVPIDKKPKYVSGKVGLADKNGAGYLVVTSNVLKECLRVADILNVIVSKSRVSAFV